MRVSEWLEHVEAQIFNSKELVATVGGICFIIGLLILFSKYLATLLLVSIGAASIYFYIEQNNQESSNGRTVDSDSTNEGSSPSS